MLVVVCKKKETEGEHEVNKGRNEERKSGKGK